MAALILIMLISILGAQTFSPGNWHKQFRVGLGLDLSSGTQVVLKAATVKGAAPSSAAMQQAIAVLESRVNGTGNSGAQVQQQGADLINVTVPGKAPQDVINLVSSTAKLAFRPVLLEEPYTLPVTATPSTTPSAKASGSVSPSATPTGSATSTATGAPTPSAGASASTSASPKASTQDYAAKLASPSATPTASGSAKASTTPSASTTPKASTSATPAPTSTAASTVTYGDATKV